MAYSWKRACPSSASRVVKGTHVMRGPHGMVRAEEHLCSRLHVVGVLGPMSLGGGGVFSCGESLQTTFDSCSFDSTPPLHL